MDIRIGQPGSGTDADMLSRFFAEFLDENAFSEFRRIERLFENLRRQGSTVSGYPVIRPSDCARITTSLDGFFTQCMPQFRTRDPNVTERFEELIGAFHEFCRAIFPSEATAVLVLHGKVLLFMGRTQQVIDLVSHLVMRPYAVENSMGHCTDLTDLFAQAHLRQGTLNTVPVSFIAFGAWLLAQPKAPSAISIALRMAPYVNHEQHGRIVILRSAVIRWASKAYLRATRGHIGVGRNMTVFVMKWIYAGLMAATYFSLRRSARHSAPFSLRMNRSGDALVTRGMGGIGDLLMMVPGLEALARKQGKSIDFAIPRKFFPVFAHNPLIRLIDIDGPALDISTYRQFANLSLCPAGRYESRTRPFVKRGRVEIFARAMGVRLSDLQTQGWHINQFLSPDEQGFCDAFLTREGLGARPIIGVQPFSRDSYKDHPGIAAIIAALSDQYDIVIFHHVANGLPQGPGIATTAGVALANSLALVSRVKVMVCVDSAFLHAAAAHDIPTIALFGPTDARTFTRHHPKVTILWKPQSFGCVPCWRNEDMPCQVTGQRSLSPCLAAITTAEVVDAVKAAIGTNR
ncbi:glycosyltransferase family 9 protein [Sphingomonas sp. So64.6b]|uniref:glycosyltransferase family 9 protein n=1 Tax=Sphingomonas sp. So64.6b TaxID=2997354 RepID=UPI0016004AA0|nr:glycosyltransferase family 9 protein [Sphingomonas sp. So64.6b]QNA82914.1 glycosyltransferase family 9 protein [Sphingomonas sp. So64.6b]